MTAVWPNLNLGPGFAADLAVAKAATDAAKAAAAALPCPECKRVTFEMLRERERADTLAAGADALVADMKAMADRLAVLEATPVSAVAVALSDTIKKLQVSDSVQRRNVALAEIYVAELQGFIREHFHVEPPALVDALGWRLNQPDDSPA